MSIKIADESRMVGVEFDFSKVDENEHLIPRPYGTLQTLNLDHLHRYAFAKAFCNNARVLDAAMGCGYASLILNCDYIGLDIDPNMVAFARQYYQPMAPNARYFCGSVLDLPINDGEIDTYISFETIEHIQPTEVSDYLQEAKRVIKPSGLFICSTPVYRGPQFGLLAQYHPYEFKYGQFATALMNAGFDLLEEWYQWPPHFSLQTNKPRFDQTQQQAPFINVLVMRRL